MHSDRCPWEFEAYLEAMDIRLAYGRNGLNVTLPETVDVLTPRFVPGLPDETEALKDALRAPI